MTKIQVKSETEELRKALQDLADAFGTYASLRAAPRINDPALVTACELLYPKADRGISQ